MTDIIDETVNCVLAQFFNAIQNDSECDVKKAIEKIKDINCKLTTTNYLQSRRLKSKWIGNTALHFTAGRNSDVFSYLLNIGADYTLKNNDNSTALHKIIEWNPEAISEACTLDNSFVNLVLSAHLKNRNFSNPTNNSELSHFHIACAANNVDLVEGFLSSGVLADHAVKADSSLFPGFTSLHFAARFCAFEVLEVLLSHGADTHIKDARGLTPLHLAVEQKIKIIYESNVDERLRENNEKIIELLLVKESSHDKVIIDNWGLSHFHIACTLKDTKVAESFLNKNMVLNINHPVNVDSPVWPGYTALHFAAFCNIDTVKLLMKKGADISIKDTKGVTPFDICIERYKAEDICEIISLNPKWKNIMLSDGKTRLTDLVFAMRNLNEFSVFIRKLSQNCSIYNSPLWPGYTPMHLAVTLSTKYIFGTSGDSEETYLQILRYLCKNNPRLLYNQDVHGHTPLHLAYRLTNEPVIDLLLKFLDETVSSQVDCTDEDGLSFLHVAAAQDDVTLLKQMLSIGSDVNAIYKGKPAFSPEVCSGSTALHFAVINNNVEAVKILMEKGADVYAKDANDMTPIHMLSIGCNYRCAQVLLTTPDLKNFVVSGSGLSHLHIACAYGKSECMESLLNKGANINDVITCRPDENLCKTMLSFLKKFEGYSPLSIAYEFQSGSIVKVLLERGADIFTLGKKEKALFYKVLEEVYASQFDNFTEVLLKNTDLQSHLKAETGMTALHIACLKPSNLENIKKLLDEGANVNARIRADSPICQGYTPLHVLLHMFSQTIDEDAFSNELPTGIVKVVELLLKRGADITLSDANSNTPVHMIFGFYDYYSETMYSCLNMMLEAQRDFSVNPVNIYGITHFHIACRILNTSVVEEFLKSANIDINQPTDFFQNLLCRTGGYTALHWAACDASEFDATRRQLNTVDLLLKHGANVNAEDAEGQTPLYRYSRNVETFSYKFLDLFERFARAGADVNARNISGKTPLYYFVKSNNITSEGIKILLRFGCRLNTFVTVTGVGYIGKILCTIPDEEMKELWSVISVNFAKQLEPDNIGRTVIHNIVSDDKSQCTASSYAGWIELLSKLGCNVDDQDTFGRTALHMAAKFGNAKGVSGLLMAGADVNISDSDGKTALTYNVDTPCKDHCQVAMNRKCKHLETLETLAVHVKKLQLCGLDVNEQNEDLVIKAFEKLGNQNALSEDFFKELETAKDTTIEDQSLTLFGFLSETGAVANYPRMLRLQKEAVDKFFSSTKIENLRKKFPELVGILLLQYKKARARPQLMELARNELEVLLGFEIPDICSDCILELLSNSELISLISSTVI